MNIVVNSQFNPMTLGQLLEPIDKYNAEYDKVDEDFSNLVKQTESWKNIATRGNSPKAYAMYKNYSDQLNNIVADFSKGLSQSTRSQLRDMKARYASEITPIAIAASAREAEVKEQLEGKSKGLVYTGDANSASIDRYLDNPYTRYSYADSSAGYKRVQNAANALTKELREGLKTGKLDNYTNYLLQEHGYSSENIGQAISDIEAAIRGDGNTKGNNVLTSILRNEMKVSGVDLWDNKEAQLDYYNRIAPALYSAIGDTKASTFENYGNRLYAKPGKGGSEYPTELDVLHWPGNLEERDANRQVFGSLLSKLTVNGKGLRPGYVGTNNKFVNPLAVYEEYEKFVQDNTPKVSPLGELGLQAAYGMSPDPRNSQSYRAGARQAMKDKFGVIDVLSKEEYESLKKLGFTSSSTFEDMYSTKIAEAIDRYDTLVRPSSINLGEHSVADARILNSMKQYGDIIDYNTGKEVKFDDIEDRTIVDYAYDNRYDDRILLQIDGKTLSVPAIYHSKEAENIIKDPRNREEKDQSKMQDMISILLRNLFNKYEKARSKTSSSV